MKTIFNANVDLSGGIEEVTNEVISQVKAVAGAIFLVATVILLVVGLVKVVTAFAKRSRNEDYNFGPGIGCLIGAVIAGVLSAGTFFSWFGV
ncbi:MAG: DUF3852 family protein [Ruminococcus sp.]|uniref:DUF3852 family protein n=1 Tax=Ruminococcus sp. TaxID=41978 RepID=UPI00287376C8|nr:DUF3852 family protein [Ruminococcus sp.]MBQ3286099.1 DUF3852 family protein [Ruminococcus sp.]MBQ9247505.1 DUF3852 family protein [Ruminococcus sp.]